MGVLIGSNGVMEIKLIQRNSLISGLYLQCMAPFFESEKGYCCRIHLIDNLCRNSLCDLNKHLKLEKSRKNLPPITAVFLFPDSNCSFYISILKITIFIRLCVFISFILVDLGSDNYLFSSIYSRQFILRIISGKMIVILIKSLVSKAVALTYLLSSSFSQM